MKNFLTMLIFLYVTVFLATGLSLKAYAQEANKQLRLLAHWLPGNYTNLEQLNSQQDIEDPSALALRMNLAIRAIDVTDLDGLSFLFSIDSDDKRLTKLSNYVVNFLPSGSKELASPVTLRNAARTDRNLKGTITTRIFLLKTDIIPNGSSDLNLNALYEHNQGCRPRTIYETGVFRSRWNTTACFHHQTPTLLLEILHKNEMTLWNMMTGPRFNLLKSTN